MKLRYLLLVLVFSAFASDSSFPATKKDQTAPQEQIAAPDQRGTEQLPLVVQPLPTKKNAEVDQQEKRETKEKTDSDWWTWLLGVLTIVALFGQLAVFIAQAYFLKGTLKVTEIVAKAADLSARAAIAIELPLIRANAGKLGYSTGPDKGVWVSDVTFSNLGRTKCFPIEVQIGCAIGDRLPEAPIYRFTEPLDTNSILDPVPEPSMEIRLTKFQFVAPPDIYEGLRTRSTNLWLYCNLIYLDFMQTRHEAGFCWKCHETIGMGVLLEDATPAYNRKT